MPLKRILFRSLKAKLLAMLMLVAFFSTISIAAMFTIYELNAVTKAEQSRLNSIANILAPNLTAALIFEDQASATEQIKSLQGQSNIVSAQVEDMKGNVFVAVVAEKDNTKQIFTDLMVVKTTLQMQGIDYGVLTIKADYSLIEASLLFFSTFLLVILVLILVLSFILSLFLRKSLIYPLIQLAAVADRVTKTSNYSLRSQVLSTDEVGNLASCFNLMLENIEQRDHSLEETVQQRTTALKVANTQLTTQAFSDPLSGLPNRRYILNKLADLIKHEKDKKFAVLALDLDGFKEINDTLGHDYGDLLLIAVSKSIASVLGTEILARLGGDEFIILVENIISLSNVESISTDIHNHLSKGFVIKGKHVYVTTSIGIAVFPEHGDTVENIVKCADLAMYKSKAAGRNCHHFFNASMLDDVVKKRELVETLRHSLKNNEFELYYQPIVDLSTNKICKAEALIRWHHPLRGLVSPFEFIPVAEEVGLITDIGEWVARTAAQDLAEFKKLNVDTEFQISINVSPLQFKGDGQWMKNWFEYIAELGLSHDAIIVEITENLLMESEENIRYQLTQLRDQGVSIAIDDFGVGYSSLSYLQKMDVDILKIDKSFVDDLETESNSRDLCKVMIMLAEQLNIQVVAEGIENEQQKQYLLEAGCQFGQGYLFSKPMPFLQFQENYFSHQSRLDLATVNPAIDDTEYKVELMKKAI
ncbi:EAL domain-containing protein [uncultured Psychromonas sp.]|uniref:bifunctional diguanylate cyclase/phosphodiesterase n=1 Tax=uncultured Psychromonas sp. TaxID=173974 RepID=UPI00262E9A5A|nr:EAL domain-containing protein [uncultured Psychromonas sp.]